MINKTATRDVKITRLAESTQKGTTKCTYNWEYTDEKNIRHEGQGRFACLEGNKQNWPGLIAIDLKRRHGTVNIIMPPERNMLGLKKAG